MKNPIQGIQNVESMFFTAQRELFERLGDGQTPEMLLITCSDSRIDPNLITQTNPGELVCVSDTGNIVPPHGVFVGGEEVTIEFAMVALGTKELVVGSYSHCGAIQGLLNLESIREKLHAIGSCQSLSDATWRTMSEKYTNSSGCRPIDPCHTRECIGAVGKLADASCCSVRMGRGELILHGWVYKIETGQVFAYDREQVQFLPLTEQTSSPIPTLCHQTAAHSN